ncbi:MAG: hypothetical protein JWP97_6008 [Labilithrix sp.]|nr:hypothetical protein [Labilithrix sp.]
MPRARPKPRPSLTFYPAEVDGKPAAFVVDLEQTPRRALGTRIVVALLMHSPVDNGLRSDDELDALDAAQEMITDRLEEAYEAEIVGFYDLDGASMFAFYAKGPKGKTAAAQEAAVMKVLGKVGSYEVEVHVAEDPDWRFYIDVLFPDDYALQGIWNRALIDELEAHGDALDEPRDVDHLATFPTKALADAAAKLLKGAHFSVDSVGPDEGEKGRWAVTFHRSETLDGDKPNRFSAEVLDIVLPLQGEYDGWGAPAVGGEQEGDEDEEEVPPSGETTRSPARSKAAKKKAAPKKKKAAKAAPPKKPAKKAAKAAPKKKAAAKKPGAKKAAAKKPAATKPATKKKR